MKNNYNIKVDPPELSSEQISKHQDFDALFAQFQEMEVPPKDKSIEEETPIHSIKKTSKFSPLMIKYGVGAVLTIAASILVVFMLQESMGRIDTEIPTEQINEVLALQAPMSRFAKPYSNLVVSSAEEGETLKYHSGSQIIVPASAFVDEKGMPVKGKVEIQYREFNDHVDMFLAGVPKEMDKHKNLQSAGMMEIKGFQDGKPVYLSMDKTLDVALKGRIATGIPTTDLKVYVYGQQDDSWEYIAEDKVEVIAKTNAAPQTSNLSPQVIEEIEAKVRVSLASSKPVKPIKPNQPSVNMQVFDFDINVDEFPELAAYNQKVRLMAKQSDLTAGTFDTVWNSMEMVGLGDNKYRMELVYEGNSENITRTFEVYPAIAPTEKTEKVYKEQMVAYKAKMEAWEQDVVLAVEEQKSGITIAGTDWKEIINRFSIHRFGLWNCGKEIELKNTLQINANFVDESGAAIAISKLFITNKDKQLYYFAPNTENTSTAALKYEAAAENKIWALTEENELLVAQTDDSSQDTELTFEMKAAGVINSEEDIRNLLTF